MQNSKFKSDFNFFYDVQCTCNHTACVPQSGRNTLIS